MTTRGPVLFSIVVLAALACQPMPGGSEQVGPEQPRLSLVDALSPGRPEGFARATAPRELTFPDDHGPHPAFQTEWWYVVGNLDADGRRFGYQLTFFRSALAPADDLTADEESSSWRSAQVFMAHFAVSDARSGTFHSFERFSRPAVGLAGARAHPFAVWLEDWRLETVSEEPSEIFPLDLRASEDDVELEMRLDSLKPPVLQGERGLSPKGPTPGNASYYYSMTRMPTTGRLTIGGRVWEVEGTSWLDREWGTSLLEPGLEGWDWFALQLSDGREIMYYRLRRDDGSTDPFSRGVVVEADGLSRGLDAGDVEVTPLRTWSSRTTGAVYPSGWRLVSPEADLDLTLEPIFAAQEHDATVLYWEGALDVAGRSAGDDVSGRGYAELTGYAGERNAPRATPSAAERP